MIERGGESWAVWKERNLENYRSGYTKATLGVEPGDVKNKGIYARYGFTEYLKSGREGYPDGNEMEVEYYGKSL